MNSIQPVILIVDDEPTFRKFLADSIKERNYRIITAATGSECIRELKNNKPDIVITDMVLPDFSGLKILELSKQLSPATDVIMITGYATMDTAIKALKMGASDYITKPVNIEELKILIKKYIDKKRVVSENIKLLNRFKIIEELKNLSIYGSIEEVLNCLAKIVKDNFLIDKQFGFVIEDSRIRLITLSGIAKKTALKLCDRTFIKNIKNITPGRFSLVKMKKGNIVVLSLGGKKKKGYFALLPKKKGESLLNQEMVDVIAEYASVYFRTISDMDETKYLTYIDDLTELYNPRYLKLILKREIRTYKEHKKPFSVLFLDLDHFKEVNDTYGHLIGGEILCEVAKVLKNSVRNADVVVRYGGDEYVIVLFNTDKAKAKIIAERISKNINNHIFLGREGYKIHLTACIGIASFPEHAKSYKKLIDYSDRAMYIGKEEERNAIHTADELKKR